jgi:starch synthase
VVRETGGLDDTILHYDPATRKGNGFKFTRYDAKEFLNTIKGAIRFYSQPRHWKQLLLNAMSADFSWSRSAEAYLQLYRKALEKKKGDIPGGG